MKRTAPVIRRKTDATQISVSLEPLVRDAIDAVRGEKSRAEKILEIVAKRLKIIGYVPRGRGSKKKIPENK